MPDITMCTGGDCKRKESCYRYKANPTPKWQSYFSNVPVNPDGTCNHFVEYFNRGK